MKKETLQQIARHTYRLGLRRGIYQAVALYNAINSLPTQTLRRLFGSGNLSHIIAQNDYITLLDTYNKYIKKKEDKNGKNTRL